MFFNSFFRYFLYLTGTKFILAPGYGSYDNYMYCRENGIELFVKYPGYYEESKKTNDKNRFRASHFERTEDGGYICPAGHEFEVDKVTTDTRGVYARNNIKLL